MANSNSLFLTLCSRFFLLSLLSLMMANPNHQVQENNDNDDDQHSDNHHHSPPQAAPALPGAPDLARVAINNLFQIRFNATPTLIMRVILRRRVAGVQLPEYIRCYFAELDSPDFFELPHYQLPGTYYFCRQSLNRPLELRWRAISSEEIKDAENEETIGTVRRFRKLYSNVRVVEYDLITQPIGAQRIALYQILSREIRFNATPTLLIREILRRRVWGFQLPEYVRSYFAEMEAPDFFALPHYHFTGTFYFCQQSLDHPLETGWTAIGSEDVKDGETIGTATWFRKRYSNVRVVEYNLISQPIGAQRIALYQILSREA